MSQAAPFEPPVPAEPDGAGHSPRRRRTRLLVVPLVIVLVLLAITSGAYGFARSQLSQAQTAESAGSYSNALASYRTVESVAGNPLSKVLLGDLNDHAVSGTAEARQPQPRAA